MPSHQPLQDNELRWIIALLGDTRTKLGKAIGLLRSDIVLDTEFPHMEFKLHPWRRLNFSLTSNKFWLLKCFTMKSVVAKSILRAGNFESSSKILGSGYR